MTKTAKTGHLKVVGKAQQVALQECLQGAYSRTVSALSAAKRREHTANTQAILTEDVLALKGLLDALNAMADLT